MRNSRPDLPLLLVCVAALASAVGLLVAGVVLCALSLPTGVASGTGIILSASALLMGVTFVLLWALLWRRKCG